MLVYFRTTTAVIFKCDRVLRSSQWHRPRESPAVNTTCTRHAKLSENEGRPQLGAPEQQSLEDASCPPALTSECPVTCERAIWPFCKRDGHTSPSAKCYTNGSVPSAAPETGVRVHLKKLTLHRRPSSNRRGTFASAQYFKLEKMQRLETSPQREGITARGPRKPGRCSSPGPGLVPTSRRCIRL